VESHGDMTFHLQNAVFLEDKDKILLFSLTLTWNLDYIIYNF